MDLDFNYYIEDEILKVDISEFKFEIYKISESSLKLEFYNKSTNKKYSLSFEENSKEDYEYIATYVIAEIVKILHDSLNIKDTEKKLNLYSSFFQSEKCSSIEKEILNLNFIN